MIYISNVEVAVIFMSSVLSVLRFAFWISSRPLLVVTYFRTCNCRNDMVFQLNVTSKRLHFSTFKEYKLICLNRSAVKPNVINYLWLKNSACIMAYEKHSECFFPYSHTNFIKIREQTKIGYIICAFFILY